MARLDELERKFEENPRRYFAPLANEYRKAGDPQRAVELCRSQLPDVPGHISGHIVLGQALFDARDFTGSRDALEAALALDPENIVALRYLGDIAREMGEAAEAERWYNRTLEADPYNEAATSALEAVRAPATPPAEHAEPAVTSPEPRAGDSPAVESEQTSDVVEPDADATAVAEAATAAAAAVLSAAPDPSLEPMDENVASAELDPDKDPARVDEDATSAEVDPDTDPARVDEDAVSAEVHPDTDLEHVDEDSPSAEFVPSGEFSGDLEISTSSSESEVGDSPSAELATVEAGAHEVLGDETLNPEEPALEERADVAAHEERADITAHADAPVRDATPLPEEAMQAEERVMETAAPFVTETMADLYMDQGYPHEALELLLQLAEQRPDDDALRDKIERIEAAIVSRRDAAVAAARAERHDAVEAAHESTEVQRYDEVVVSADDEPRDAVGAPVEQEPDDEVALPPDEERPEGPAEPQEESNEAQFHPAFVGVDASAFVVGDAIAFDEHSPASEFAELETASSAEASAAESQPSRELISVREMFARMDRARPRPQGAVVPKPIARLRSDFAPMPEGAPEPASASGDDPFAFPDAQPRPTPAESFPRSSGPHPTFNPSTAGLEDFDAWLRGLKGP